MNEVFAIDIGGTKTSIAIIGKEKDQVKVWGNKSFPTLSDPEHQIQKIKEEYSFLKRKLKVMSLSLPGMWSGEGVLKESLFLSDWLEYPFVTTLANEVEIKDYCFETDVICGALGEYHYGVETCHGKSLLYVNLGTGIGAAYIKDGKPFKSLKYPTLRMQKLVFPFQDELFSAVDLISGGRIISGTQYSSPDELFDAYKKADIEAIDLISKAQTQLACWLINLFYLFAPEVIILNGGLTYNFEVLAEGAIEIANEELNSQVKIIPSKLKELAPIYGAYQLCVSRMMYNV